ncbi:pilus assembly protein [Geoalkalibacter subterraneus]|nr:PilC/PilY family type IV pilus protein [Geoalkalibacter subterraneus]
MVRRLFFVFTATFCLVTAAITWAGSDTYLGDTAIYTGDPAKVKPNILFIIDNSKATLNKAAGQEYFFDADSPYPDPDTGVQGSPWDIYEGDNQGNFTALLLSNDSVVESGGEVVNFNNLATFSNCPDVVAHDLVAYGTYTADGTAERPIIKANQNKCVTAPKGSVYALNNYIYYTKTPPDTPVVEVDGEHYKLLAEHTSTESNKPGFGDEWQDYWAVTDFEGAADAWAVAIEYSLGGDALNQREIMYNALEQVLKSTYHLANFGAMIYGANNKGGTIIQDVTDFGSDSTDSNNNKIPDVIEDFLAALPGPGENDGPAAITAGPQRPQSEALYDAGAYLGADWTPITETSSIPADLAIDCNTHVIFLTNGLSNSEGDPKLAANIGDADNNIEITYRGTVYPDVDDEGVYGLGVHYLDDVAFKLWNEYEVATHMILAFQKQDGLIVRAAVNGKGEFHNVFNANELVAALQGLIFRMVLEENTSFVAPVVPASTTNRTLSSDRVYLGLFKPQQGKPWLGNLKKYKVNDQNELEDINSDSATEEDGDFITATNSFWGVNNAGDIMALSNSDNGGLATRPASSGDGGLIDAGGAAGTMLARKLAGEDRKVVTYLGPSTSLNHTDNKIDTANLTAENTGIADSEERDDLIAYLLGDLDLFDHDDDGIIDEPRPWLMGDILHSRPVVFHYQDFDADKEQICYQSDPSGNRSYIFVGSNEGMIHAIRDCDGSEAWAFIPPNLLPKLKHLQDPAHQYMVDSSPTLYVHDHNENGKIEEGDLVLMVIGQGRGGGSNRLLEDDSRGAYTVLDVTDPEAPVFLWDIDNTLGAFSEIGETWSQPRLTKVKVNDGGTEKTKVVAFVGAGYDNNEDLRWGATQTFPASTDDTTDLNGISAGSANVTSSNGAAPHNPKGRGLYAFEVATLNKNINGQYVPSVPSEPTLIWAYTPTENSDLTFSFPTDLAVLDVNADGYADTIYAGDTGGRMWRFKLAGNNPATDWTGNIIFNANTGALDVGRKIFYRPSVTFDRVKIQEGDQVVNRIRPILYFGTGDRSHPLNTAVTDRLYKVVDKGQATADAINHTDLMDVTGNELQLADTTPDQAQAILDGMNDANNYGWYIDLEDDGEKALAGTVVFNNIALYTTYTPNNLIAPDPCNPNHLGTARVYGVNAKTGEAILNWDPDNDGENTDGNERAENTDGYVLRKADRVKTIGQGIPSGIVTLIDASGQATLMISSSNRVNTIEGMGARLINPVYWMQW